MFSTALAGALGGGTWPCISASPGIRNLPRPSMRVASAGTRTLALAPTSTMRSPRTTTVWFCSTGSVSMGSTATLVKAIVRGSACWVGCRAVATLAEAARRMAAARRRTRGIGQAPGSMESRGC